jgi:hypothetical protein
VQRATVEGGGTLTASRGLGVAFGERRKAACVTRTVSPAHTPPTENPARGRGRRSEQETNYLWHSDSVAWAGHHGMAASQNIEANLEAHKPSSSGFFDPMP